MQSVLLIASVLLFAASPRTPQSKPAAQPFVWKNVVIGGGGYVLDVYCHPKERDLVYIRTDVGGFYRLNPTGHRWTPLTEMFGRDKSNYYGGESLAVDPTNPEVVYLAAGKYRWGNPPGTIFRSADRGAHWTKLPIDLKMGGNENLRWAGNRLAVDPLNPKTLLFGSREEGMWRSSDSGDHWNQVSSFPAGAETGIGITSIVFSNTKSGLVYAANYGQGLAISSDDGVTWLQIAGAPKKILRLALDPQNTLYATHDKGISRYQNSSWRTITPAGVADGFNGLSINPRNPKDIIAISLQNQLHLYRTLDGGSVWKQVTTRVQSEVPWYSPFMRTIQAAAGLTFDPHDSGCVWLADWYAVYRTENINADPVLFTNLERGHEELVAFDMCAPPGGPPLVSGTADVDGMVHTDLEDFPRAGIGDYYGGSGPTFGDCTSFAWCAKQPERVVRAGSTRWNERGGGAISDDGGRTWRAFPNWDSKIKPARIAISADDPNNFVVLRIGKGPALYTKDGGTKWAESSGLPENIIPEVWNWQVPLAADGTRPGQFYVYTQGNVYRSEDYGASFQLAGSGLKQGGASIAVTAPGLSGQLWLALGAGGLLHSSDGGDTFAVYKQVMQADLFAVGKPAPGFVVPSLYLLGTLTDGRTGIFQSQDSGRSWKQIDDPKIPIGDEPNCMRASWQTYGLLFIGTNGRGIYYGAPAPLK